MDWTDTGTIIGTRRHGETGVIVELMTAGHGRHLGLVRGGRSRRQQPVLQPGNRVTAVWRARLDEHLGNYTLEPDRLRAAAIMADPVGLYGLHTLSALLRLLPERDPHPGLHRAADVILDSLGKARLVGELMARFELEILNELGFGLDLSRCAATGAAEGLTYVSPRTGRAVTAAAGAAYADKLLALPGFLVERRAGEPPEPGDLNEAFRLTGYFLDRHVCGPRGAPLPAARSRFIELVGGPNQGRSW